MKKITLSLLGGLTLATQVFAASSANTVTMNGSTSMSTFNSGVVASTQVQNNNATVSGSQTLMANNASGPMQSSMSVVNNPGQATQVVVNLVSPATLTVYDQNGDVAFTQSLKPGKTTIDTSNFPLGQDQLVVTVNQTGSTFKMVQNVLVQAPQMMTNS